MHQQIFGADANENRQARVPQTQQPRCTVENSKASENGFTNCTFKAELT